MPSADREAIHRCAANYLSCPNVSKDRALAELLLALEPVIAGVVVTNTPRRLPAWLSREDLLGEGRAAALRCIEAHRPSEGYLGDYVAKGVRNAVVSLLRGAEDKPRTAPAAVRGRAGERAMAAVADTRPTPMEAAVHSELRDFVAELPHPDRRILEAHYFEGLTDAEIAAELTRSRASVTKRRLKLVTHLRGRYDEA